MSTTGQAICKLVTSKSIINRNFALHEMIILNLGYWIDQTFQDFFLDIVKHLVRDVVCISFKILLYRAEKQ